VFRHGVLGYPNGDTGLRHINFGHSGDFLSPFYSTFAPSNMTMAEFLAGMGERAGVVLGGDSATSHGRFFRPRRRSAADGGV
jgi:hypothetical protein